MPTQGPIRRGPRRNAPHQLQVGPSIHPLSQPLFGGRTGLWINGVEYTAFLSTRSPRIRNSANSQVSVFSFRLEAELT